MGEKHSIQRDMDIIDIKESGIFFKIPFSHPREQVGCEQILATTFPNVEDAASRDLKAASPSALFHGKGLICHTAIKVKTKESCLKTRQ